MRWVLMGLAAMLAASAAQAASLEAYSKQLSMRLVSISPDGSKVAFVQLIDGKQAVVIDQLNPAAVIANIPPGDHKYESLTWVDPNHLIVFGVHGANGTAQVVDLEKRKITPLMEKTELVQLSGGPKIRIRDGRTSVFVAGYSRVDGGYAETFESVDFATGKEQRVARLHSRQAAGWDIDADGALLSQSIYDEVSHVWTLQLRRGSDWIDTLSDKILVDPPRIAGSTPDGKDLVLQRITDDHGLEFRRLSLSDGKLGDLVPEYLGLTRLVYDPLTLRPIGGEKEGMEPNYVFFDPKDQALWDGVAKVFPDEEVQLTSWSHDRSKVVVLVTGLKHGVAYEVVDLATHRAMGIGPAFADVKPGDLADVLMAAYSAKDGLPIQALLTLPTGRDPKNLPLIVLQPQFRGSAGFGWKLE
jgi:dipeptidyl aminopeptidase/acylaminoacyl peptidase